MRRSASLKVDAKRRQLHEGVRAVVVRGDGALRHLLQLERLARGGSLVLAVSCGHCGSGMIIMLPLRMGRTSSLSTSLTYLVSRSPRSCTRTSGAWRSPGSHAQLAAGRSGDSKPPSAGG